MGKCIFSIVFPGKISKLLKKKIQRKCSTLFGLFSTYLKKYHPSNALTLGVQIRKRNPGWGFGKVVGVIWKFFFISWQIFQVVLPCHLSSTFHFFPVRWLLAYRANGKNCGKSDEKYHKMGPKKALDANFIKIEVNSI